MPCNTGPPTCGPSPTSGEPPPTLNQPPGDPRARLQRTESAQTLPDVNVSSPNNQGGSFAEAGSAKHQQRRLELDRETKWCELPLAQWMQRYTPGGQPPVGVTSTPFIVDLEHREQGMYGGLSTGLNEVLAIVGWTEYEALSTGRLPDSLTTSPLDDDDRNVLRPDLGIYPRTEQAALPSLPGTYTDARVAWHSVEVLIEVKWDLRAFPFSSRHTPRSPFLPSGRERCLSRGQLVEYATEVFNRQHRQSLFIVVFVQDCARFVRFDHSGATVSEEFNYLAHPEVIATFLYRLSKMRLSQRGYDPSATRPSNEEEAIFRSLSAKYPEGSATQRGLCKAASEGWPVYKLTVDAPFSADGKALTRGTPPSRRQFLIGKPSSSSTSLTGRGTRTFVAYDLAANQVVSIKDTWRVDSAGPRSELETYLHLRENATGELYIPTLLGGGDVFVDGEQQRTDALDGRVHTRLVFKEICRSLEDFTNAFELVKCVTCALVAHAKAWRECDLLHRNISTDNILIYDASETGKPDPVTTIDLLAHWDLASQSVVHDPGGINDNIGYWPFVSARLQEHPKAPPGLADDLESFMHVLNVCVLKHLQHALSDDAHQAQLAHVLQSLYDSRPGHKIASPLRLEKVQNGMPFVRGLPDGHPVRPLLSELSHLCKLHYEHVYPPPTNPARAPWGLDNSISTGGVVCGLDHGALPDFDIGSTEDEREDGRADVLVEPIVSVRDPALSPLRDHDRMVSACMRAIRKVWPRVDRVQHEKARGHRALRKRTWSVSGSHTQDGEDPGARKKTRTSSSANATLVKVAPAPIVCVHVPGSAKRSVSDRKGKREHVG